MTVPSLMQNYQRQSYVTQLHKVYNITQQAFLQELQEKNAINLVEAGITSQSKMAALVKSKMKVIADCKTHVSTPCFADKYYNLSGTVYDSAAWYWGQAFCSTLASGTSICIDQPTVYTLTVDGVASKYGHVFIDVNGQKGPNMFGRDAFFAVVYTDGSLDEIGATPECKQQGICKADSLEAIRSGRFNTLCKTSQYGQGCLGKIINDNWQMTY